MVTLYETETALTANALTLHRGTEEDILEVLVYYDEDPNAIPAYGDFTAVEFITSGPLQEGNLLDVLASIGPGINEGEVQLDPGDFQLAGDPPPAGRDHQRFVGWRTASEFRFARVDVTTVYGTGD